MSSRIFLLLGLVYLIISCSEQIATDYQGYEAYTISPASTLSEPYTYSIENFALDYDAEAEVFNAADSLNSANVSAIFEAGITRNNLFVLKKDLLKHALYITDNANYSYYGREGLAYVWGSKNSKKVIRPSYYKGAPNICSDKLYGLDCSGFIYEIFTSSMVNLPNRPRNYANAQWLSTTKNWIEPLNNYLECNGCYRVTKPQAKSLQDLQSGDLIYFKLSPLMDKVHHIGIVFKYGNEAILFESMGNPRDNCATNIKQGPRRIKLTTQFLSSRYYEILRISQN